jgi:hypothetical protein
LSIAAKAKAEADQFKYIQFQNNLKDFYKDFNEVKVEGIMQKDYPEINKEYALLAGDIASNYDVLRNPVANPEKYAELKQREAELRGRIAQSKQDLAYVDAHKGFVKGNPNFNTQGNNSRIQEFESKPIGERNLFALDTPFSYDPAERAKLANQRAERKLTDEQTKGRYINSTESLEYLKDEFLSAWRELGTMQDKNGRPILQAAEDSYKKVYADQFKNGVSFQEVDDKVGLSLLNQSSMVKKLREDPVAAQEDQQKFNAGQNAADRSLRRELSNDKELEGAGRDYNEALTSGYSTGYVRPELLQGLFGDNSEIKLTEKGKEPIYGKDGKTIVGYNDTGKETATSLPKIQVTGSRLDPKTGELIVSRVDNSSGKPVPIEERRMSYDEAREAFKNLAGSKNAGKVADAAEAYRKKYSLGTNPDLESMKKHFDFGEGKPEPPPVKSLKKLNL